MNLPPIDWTESFRLPADAAQKMAAVVPDVKGQKFDAGAWARNRVSEPSGFGPPKGNWPKGPTKVREDERVKIPPAPKSYWSK